MPSQAALGVFPAPAIQQGGAIRLSCASSLAARRRPPPSPRPRPQSMASTPTFARSLVAQRRAMVLVVPSRRGLQDCHRASFDFMQYDLKNCFLVATCQVCLSLRFPSASSGCCGAAARAAGGAKRSSAGAALEAAEVVLEVKASSRARSEAGLWTNARNQESQSCALGRRKTQRPGWLCTSA